MAVHFKGKKCKKYWPIFCSFWLAPIWSLVIIVQKNSKWQWNRFSLGYGPLALYKHLYDCVDGGMHKYTYDNKIWFFLHGLGLFLAPFYIQNGPQYLAPMHQQSPDFIDILTSYYPSSQHVAYFSSQSQGISCYFPMHGK